MRETVPGLDGDRCVRASPCPDDFALDQKCARPDARGPERTATIGVGDEELASGPVEEEVRVAAGEEPRGRREPRGSSERRFVVCEDPRVADRSPHGGQRRTECLERSDPTPWA